MAEFGISIPNCVPEYYRSRFEAVDNREEESRRWQQKYAKHKATVKLLKNVEGVEMLYWTTTSKDCAVCHARTGELDTHEEDDHECFVCLFPECEHRKVLARTMTVEQDESLRLVNYSNSPPKCSSCSSKGIVEDYWDTETQSIVTCFVCKEINCD